MAERLLSGPAMESRRRELARVAELLAAGSNVALRCGVQCQRTVCHGQFLARHLPALAAGVPAAQAAAVAAACAAASRAMSEPLLRTADGLHDGEAEVPVPSPAVSSPDVRPVNVGNVSRRAILGHVTRVGLMMRRRQPLPPDRCRLGSREVSPFSSLGYVSCLSSEVTSLWFALICEMHIMRLAARRF